MGSEVRVPREALELRKVADLCIGDRVLHDGEIHDVAYIDQREGQIVVRLGYDKPMLAFWPDHLFAALRAAPAPAAAGAEAELAEAMCELLSAMQLRQRPWPNLSLLFQVEKADFDKARAVYERHAAALSAGAGAPAEGEGGAGRRSPAEAFQRLREATGDALDGVNPVNEQRADADFEARAQQYGVDLDDVQRIVAALDSGGLTDMEFASYMSALSEVNMARFLLDLRTAGGAG